MKPVFIFQHIESNRPGYFADFLGTRGIPYRLVHIWQGEPVPDDAREASGLCFLGGTMSVNDDLPWIERECALIRAAHADGIPVIGHCLGGQLISKALGGRVGANPVHEIGWHPLRPVESPATPDWLGAFEEPLMALNWHFETFTVPAGAHALLASDHCENQAFVLGRSLALQCHIEVTESIVTDWLGRYNAEIQPGPSVHSAAEISAGIDSHLPRAQRLAEHLYERWAEGLESTRTVLPVRRISP